MCCVYRLSVDLRQASVAAIAAPHSSRSFVTWRPSKKLFTTFWLIFVISVPFLGSLPSSFRFLFNKFRLSVPSICSFAFTCTLHGSIPQAVKAFALRPMTMETQCSKVIFPNYAKKKPAEDTLVPPLWGTREKKCLFF